MLLDVVIGILLLTALFKGLKNGLVKAVFSLLGVVIGIAAALKLSAVTAKRLSETDLVWLPFLSFLIVFLIVAIAVGLVGRIVHASVNFAMMGWLNKLGGVVFYLALYIIVITVFIFYLSNMHWIPEKLTSGSLLYAKFETFGLHTVSSLEKVFPFFADAFEELKLFFGTFEEKI